MPHNCFSCSNSRGNHLNGFGLFIFPVHKMTCYYLIFYPFTSWKERKEKAPKQKVQPSVISNGLAVDQYYRSNVKKIRPDSPKSTHVHSLSVDSSAIPGIQENHIYQLQKVLQVGASKTIFQFACLIDKGLLELNVVSRVSSVNNPMKYCYCSLACKDRGRFKVSSFRKSFQTTSR
ncbi:hypothetical protein VNO77_24697 [Canavalia gladiata]|uniref:Uncharacterized protein n=1 Tax=Canavalia gladiata TaxID=3824 RepID=A0AAN9L9B3_CANGL